MTYGVWLRVGDHDVWFSREELSRIIEAALRLSTEIHELRSAMADTMEALQEQGWRVTQAEDAS